MKTIIVDENQTIYDIAMEYYGNIEALEEIISLNPDISNDLHGLERKPEVFHFDLPITNGSELIIDEESELVQKKYSKRNNRPGNHF